MNKKSILYNRGVQFFIVIAVSIAVLDVFSKIDPEGFIQSFSVKQYLIGSVVVSAFLAMACPTGRLATIVITSLGLTVLADITRAINPQLFQELNIKNLTSYVLIFSVFMSFIISTKIPEAKDDSDY